MEKTHWVLCLLGVITGTDLGVSPHHICSEKIADRGDVHQESPSYTHVDYTAHKLANHMVIKTQSPQTSTL